MIYIKIIEYNTCDDVSIESLAKEMRQKYYKNSCDILRGENGKPYFKDKKLCFNGSHSKGMIAVALSENDIGLDIEKIRDRKFDEIAEYTFRKEESDYIKNSCDKAKYFFTLWTMKEAYLKLNGRSVTSMKNTPFIDIADKKVFSQTNFAVFEIEKSYILSVSLEHKTEIEIECSFEMKEILFENCVL